MSLYAKENETGIEHKYFDSKATETNLISNRVETYKSIYAELKKDFRVYLSKYM
jgi:hypothetical protein